MKPPRHRTSRTAAVRHGDPPGEVSRDHFAAASIQSWLLKTTFLPLVFDHDVDVFDQPQPDLFGGQYSEAPPAGDATAFRCIARCAQVRVSA